MQGPIPRLALTLLPVVAVAAVALFWSRRDADSGESATRALEKTAYLERTLRERDDTIADLRRQVDELSRSVASLTSSIRQTVTEPSATSVPITVAKVDGGVQPATVRENAALGWLQRVLGDKFEKRGADALEFLRHGTILDLRGTVTTDDDLANLWVLPNLESLGLQGTEVTDTGLRHLAALPKLEFLNLRATAVAGPGLAALPNSLRHVDLTDSQAGATGFQSLPPLPRLATLKLNRLPVGDTDLDVLPRWPLLRHLEIDGTKITADGLVRLMAANPGLTRVEVRGLSLSTEQLDRLRQRYPQLDLVWGDPMLGMLRGR
ncbi:MAG: hypothetical protein R3F56_21750 [Planctomycetota bacterium]